MNIEELNKIDLPVVSHDISMKIIKTYVKTFGDEKMPIVERLNIARNIIAELLFGLIDVDSMSSRDIQYLLFKWFIDLTKDRVKTNAKCECGANNKIFVDWSLHKKDIKINQDTEILEKSIEFPFLYSDILTKEQIDHIDGELDTIESKKIYKALNRNINEYKGSVYVETATKYVCKTCSRKQTYAFTTANVVVFMIGLLYDIQNID